MGKFEKQAFGLKILQNGHPDIRRLRKMTGTPTIHGNKFWKATYLLMDYLTEFPPAKNSRVLELGCGWGLGGIYCAKMFGAQITSLDADASVFPYLLHHADINGVDVKPWKNRYEKVRQVDLAAFDLVIGADICFWDQMANPLFNLVRRASKTGSTRVVMTDPGRPPFRDMAQRCVDTLGAQYDDWLSCPPHDASGVVLDLDPDAHN